MNAVHGDWPVPESQARPRLVTLLPVATREVRRHPLALAGVFAVIALAALAAGLLLPKKYATSTTLVVEQSNVAAPLLEGRDVSSGVGDMPAAAREIAFSPAVMDGVLAAGGWHVPGDQAERDALAAQVAARTQVSSSEDNKIYIAYVDSDPQRALAVTRRYAELIAEESLARKARASHDAFQFIDGQVEQYRQKLDDAANRLQAYRSSHPDALPGAQNDSNTGIGDLRKQIENARLDLADARAQEAAVRAQLSGRGGSGPLGAQIAAAQAELAKLQLAYTDQHPDVIRAQQQLAQLQAQAATGGTGMSSTDPLYTQLQGRLADARGRSAAAASRVSAGEALLGAEVARSTRVSASANDVSELSRDYEINRDVYQDLLKRREDARVAMNLDAAHRGLLFRVVEPAVLPTQPSGLRFIHVAAAGLLAAVLTPLLLLAGIGSLDPRVRVPQQIEHEAGLPVLGVVPSHASAPQRARSQAQFKLAGLLVLLVAAAYGAVVFLKLANLV